MNNIPDRSELTGDVENIHCDNCNEEFLFYLKDNVHEFCIGLVDILECLLFAEKQGAIPPIPPEWWLKIERRHPDLSRRE